MDFSAKFEEGLSYEDFLSTYGTEEQRNRWAAVQKQVTLTADQRELLAGFTRDMKIFCLAGAWCGDCVNQCPIFFHFAAATPRIDLRFFDRDAHPDLGQLVTICGGSRVPTVLFVSEDGFSCGHYGDRTLAKYRDIAKTQLGSSCPTGIVVPGQPLLNAVVQEWLNEFERIQWMLRTSGRLRQLHGD